MDTTFYFETREQANQFKDEARKCFVVAEVNATDVVLYDYHYLTSEHQSHVKNLAKRIYSEVTDNILANERFKGLSLEDCVKLWNNHAADPFNALCEMHPMHESEWWNKLASALGGWEFFHAILNSSDFFNDTDRYFFYNYENDCFYSFSTKQELVEMMGDEFFVESLMNE